MGKIKRAEEAASREEISTHTKVSRAWVMKSVRGFLRGLEIGRLWRGFPKEMRW